MTKKTFLSVKIASIKIIFLSYGFNQNWMCWVYIFRFFKITAFKSSLVTCVQKKEMFCFLPKIPPLLRITSVFIHFQVVLSQCRAIYNSLTVPLGRPRIHQLFFMFASRIHYLLTLVVLANNVKFPVIGMYQVLRVCR